MKFSDVKIGQEFYWTFPPAYGGRKKLVKIAPHACNTNARLADDPNDKRKFYDYDEVELVGHPQEILYGTHSIESLSRTYPGYSLKIDRAELVKPLTFADLQVGDKFKNKSSNKDKNRVWIKIADFVDEGTVCNSISRGNDGFKDLSFTAHDKLVEKVN